MAKVHNSKNKEDSTVRCAEKVKYSKVKYNMLNDTTSSLFSRQHFCICCCLPLVVHHRAGCLRSDSLSCLTPHSQPDVWRGKEERRREKG